METYERQLGFSREQLIGKRVLDLGGGPEAKLARELTAQGITSLVVSVSPDYSLPEHRKPLKASGKPIPKGHPAEPFVAAKGQQLPFVDDSFDVVLGLHLAEHVTLGDNTEILREINRLTAPNGWARYGTLIDTYDADIYGTATKNGELGMELTAKGNALERSYIDQQIAPPLRVRHDQARSYFTDAYLISLGNGSMPAPTNAVPTPDFPLHP